MAVYFLGAFPPTYGGVTIKNESLYQALSKYIDLKKVDFNQIKRFNFVEIFRLLFALCGRDNQFVIGVSGKKTRKRFTELLYAVNSKAMRRSLLFLMGGTASHDIVSDYKYLALSSKYLRVYAETESMCQELKLAGVNAGLYPNGRFRPHSAISSTNCRSERLRCVFFSFISAPKGADLVLEAAMQLPEVQFDFYGQIDNSFKTIFDSTVSSIPNVQYHGAFGGSNDEVYQELAKYDVLLFPTKWEVEGVPGIIVEAKIAGITPIVSNSSYNAELVQDGVDGIVLGENSAAAIVEALNRFARDRDMLSEMKKCSQRSSEMYYIERFIPEILADLCREKYEEN